MTEQVTHSLADEWSQCDALTIGEAAKNVGLTSRAIRYYELIGLTRPALRERHNFRLYDDKALGELRFIARCRAIGLTVAQIRALCSSSGDGPKRSGRPAVVREQLRLTEGRIRELIALRRELRQRLAIGAGADPL
ncbi:MAG: MerR family transcriptional regulator [Kiloniellaceae bacterium]